MDENDFEWMMYGLLRLLNLETDKDNMNDKDMRSLYLNKEVYVVCS